MVMCKNCLDTTIYEWRQIDGRWKLINADNGQIHQCKRDKPIEISASTHQLPPKKEGVDWGEMVQVKNGFGGVDLQRENYYKCEKCPHTQGIFNKKDPEFRVKLNIHNSTLHPFGNDYSWVNDDETETP